MIQDNVWIEKYRPNTFEEIVGQEDIIQAIKPRINNLPHIIFEGKAGTGKTTTAKVIAETIGADFMELNSSEERGIDTVRGKIMSFCKHLSILGNNAPYKILFLDEADSMTNEAQLALRPLMEKHAHNCRFIIGCNYIDKIIPPIKSRCKIYRFRPVSTDSIIKRLRVIVGEEIHLSISEQDYKEIAENSRGDMRKAINDLQMGDYGNTETAQVFNL